MRKISLLMIFIFSVIAGFGQISITAEEVIGAGDVIVQANDEDPDPSIVPGDAGANMSWDFSALIENDVDTSYVMLPGETPYGGYFPEANLAMNATDTGFMYMIKNNQKMSWIGLVADIDVRSMMDPLEEFIVNVVPEDVVAEFPVEYGNSMNDSYYIMFEAASGEPGIDSVRLKMSYDETEDIDAWGQLTLPLGTYNVLRSRIQSTSVDSMWFKSAIGWTFAFSSSTEYETYNWWSDDPGTGFVIASLDIDETGEVNGATYLNNEVIQNISENNLKDISVELYPNPVENTLHIDFAEPFTGSIRIIDLTGQLVKEQTIDSKMLRMDLHTQSSGVYFYDLQDKKGNTYRSGKIIKQ